MKQICPSNSSQPHSHGSTSEARLDNKVECEANEILARLRHAMFPERRSEMQMLFDKILDRRSGRLMELVYEQLSKAGMLEDLREISRSLTLRAIILAFSDFNKVNGRFPEMESCSSTDEFLLAAWSFFFVRSPDPFNRGALKSSPKWIEDVLKGA